MKGKVTMEILGEEIAIYQRPIDLLLQLIRFDTTNPPGNDLYYVAARL
jgi:hypothetical protein